MQEVHVDEPAGSRGFKAAAGGTIGELHYESRSAHNEARQQRSDGPGAVKARPQDSKDETGGDWRADVGLEALQIDVELAADVVNERNPKQSEQNHNASRHAPEIYQILLRGLRTELLVK